MSAECAAPSKPTSDVTEFGSHFGVSPGSAVKVKYCEMRLTLDVLQHRAMI